MGIDITDTKAEQLLPLDHCIDLVVSGNDCLLEMAHFDQPLGSISDIAECHLADHARVHQHALAHQQVGQKRVRRSNVVDPN